MTSKRLRKERPFLWLCVMAVSSTDVARQNALGRAVREIAAREIMVEGERRIDLLLGLLCFIGWCVPFSFHTILLPLIDQSFFLGVIFNSPWDPCS